MNRVLVVCSLLIVFLLAGSPLAQGPVAVPADRLADSVGVNVHLHHTDTGYGDFELIKWLLAQLGVGHVRDGLIDTAWATGNLAGPVLGGALATASGDAAAYVVAALLCLATLVAANRRPGRLLTEQP